jgi:hypothetical protein
MRTELLAIACAALAVLTAQMRGVRFSVSRPRPSRSVDHSPRASRQRGNESRLAWTGLAAATVAILGHLVVPAADIAWAALLAIGIVSVPVAAAVSLTRGRNRGGS